LGFTARVGPAEGITTAADVYTDRAAVERTHQLVRTRLTITMGIAPCSASQTRWW